MVSVCHKYNFASWYVTSAKSGSNVETAFMDLIRRALDQDKVIAEFTKFSVEYLRIMRGKK